MDCRNKIYEYNGTSNLLACEDSQEITEHKQIIH